MNILQLIKEKIENSIKDKTLTDGGHHRKRATLMSQAEGFNQLKQQRQMLSQAT